MAVATAVFYRLPALRQLAGRQLARGVPTRSQRRWAAVHDVRFIATTQPRWEDPSVLERYRDRLDRKAREEGHAGVDELKKAYEARIHDLRAKESTIGMPPPPPPPTPSQDDAAIHTQETSSSHPPGTPAPNTHTPRSAPRTPSSTGVKPLSAILDMEKARPLPVKELTAIWRLRHASDPSSLCAVIPAHTFSAMEATARRCPQFVLPVPHPERGAEMHFLQWTWDAETSTSTVLFTQLAEYKARGEFACPHTTVTHHADMATDKGVVLMHGTVATDRGVKPDDARWLVMCLQKFYGGWDGGSTDNASPSRAADDAARQRAEERRLLLEWFASGDEKFSVDRLLEAAERMG